MENTIEEAIDAVTKLNEEVFDKGKDNLPDNLWTPWELHYWNEGIMEIRFLDWVVWNSIDEERSYNEKEDKWEPPLQEFVKDKAKDILQYMLAII